ncbi:MAG: hypothetical protein ABWX66_05570 [Lacisediminihabitans sp.]
MSDSSGTDSTPFFDREAEYLADNDLVTNDAVAGETVTFGVGDGNDGPTGGSPNELKPYSGEHDLEGEELDLKGEPSDEEPPLLTDEVDSIDAVNQPDSTVIDTSVPKEMSDNEGPFL